MYHFKLNNMCLLVCDGLWWWTKWIQTAMRSRAGCHSGKIDGPRSLFVKLLRSSHFCLDMLADLHNSTSEPTYVLVQNWPQHKTPLRLIVMSTFLIPSVSCFCSAVLLGKWLDLNYVYLVGICRTSSYLPYFKLWHMTNVGPWRFDLVIIKPNISKYCYMHT